jgi:transposase
MIVLETIAKVRRDHFVHGKRIKEISRERGISRNSVRKILRSGDTEFTYERPSQPLPKLGPFVSHLEVMLEANERRPKRDRLRLTRIFDDLRREGYAGGYDSVRRYARRWREKRTTGVANAFVPLSFAPGEAYQFDWSHEDVLMGGVTTKVKVAHLRFCHSRMPFLIAYPRESEPLAAIGPRSCPSRRHRFEPDGRRRTEMVFDAHDQAFAFFGGACARGIYDSEARARHRFERRAERRRRSTRS